MRVTTRGRNGLQSTGSKPAREHPGNLTVIAAPHDIHGNAIAPSGRVRGKLIRAHLSWIRDFCSRDQMIELFEALPRDSRHQIAMLVDGEWVPMSILVELDRLVRDQFSSGDLAILEELGRGVAKSGLAAVAVYLQPEELHPHLHALARTDEDNLDFARRRWLPGGSHAGVMVHDDSSWDPVLCAVASGTYAGTAEAHHFPEVRVVESECRGRGSDRCAFEIAWS